MKRALALLLTAALLLITAHRLPAPIVEEEKATPSAEQSEAPKRKHSTKTTQSSEEQASTREPRAKTAPAPVSQGPARFAGTWSGKVNQGLLGHVPTSVTVDATATSVELNRNLGGGTRPATIN